MGGPPGDNSASDASLQAGDVVGVATGGFRPFRKTKTKAEKGLCSHRGCPNPANSGTVCHTHYSRGARARRRATGKPLWPTTHAKKKRMPGSCFSEREWLELYQAQHGQCLVCASPLKNRWRPNDPHPPTARVAHLDHDHALEKALRDAGHSWEAAIRGSARGLLCWLCNSLLVRHWTPERLERAALYCRQRPALAILARLN